MRGVLLFILSSSVHSCWFYSKDHAVENIRTMMHRDGVNFIDRKYLRENKTSAWTIPLDSGSIRRRAFLFRLRCR